jgi:hypothetical protein
MSVDLGFIGTLSQAKAQKAATQAQMRAIKEQRKFLFENLNPEAMQPAVLAADIARAKNQRALQEQMDPALAAGRALSQQQMLDELQKNGVLSGQVAEQAAKEAMAPGQSVEAKSALIDAALDHLKQGATLPPDVQAELVQAGLEKSGMVTGRSSAQGIGGTMLRTILGQAGLNLQMQRQQQAENLLASASNLEAQRQNVLNTLFPNLSSLQSQNLARDAGVFNLSQSAMPNAGMSGTDVANIWLARVGAANSLTQQQGNVASNAALAQGNIFSNAMGSAGVNLNQAIDLGKKIFSSTPATTPAATSAAVDASVSAGPVDAPVY